MSDDFDVRSAAIASTRPGNEAAALASVYVGDQLARIADAADVARDVPSYATLLTIERTAREVTALLGGGPSADPPGWTFAGEPIDGDVADPLLRLHDYLNDAKRERASDGAPNRGIDSPPPAGFEGEIRL